MKNDDKHGLVPRADFPILDREINGRRMLYLDSAATTFKPRQVLDAMHEYHTQFNSNVFRGNHQLAEEASDAFDDARIRLGEFLSADPTEITFWLNTTDAINAVANGLALDASDRVLVPISEHHSNYVPWLHHATVDTLSVDGEGFVDPDEIRRKLAEGPARLVALAHVSNVSGAIQPVREIGAICQEMGVPLLVDGAQAAPHLQVDVEELGCSFYAFSAHKMLGPTGVGAMWARGEALDELRPFRFGGGMVLRVRKDGFEQKDAPHGYEAGTPNVAGIIGFGAALRYLSEMDPEATHAHERALVTRMLERVEANPHLQLIGPKSPDRRVSLACVFVDAPGQNGDTVSFKLSDRFAIMTRSGTHCAQPYYHYLGQPTSLRLSAYVYTSVEEVDHAFDCIEELLG